MPANLSGLLSPHSVAVIGASRSPEKVGAIVLKNLLESKFNGQIFPVNPNTDSVSGLVCYKNYPDIPVIPDLAIVALPAPLVLDNLKIIGEKGTKNVIVFTAGFKETGPEGKALEQQLTGLAAHYQLNLLGPNCLGFVNNLCPINATFSQSVSLPGNLRFISQSGAIASSIFDWCESVSLGFSDFVTLGNKSVLSENDILAYWEDAGRMPSANFNRTGLSDVNPIGLYLEQISDGRRFLEISARMSLDNPLFIIKPGHSPAAAAAMLSHTGAIAGEDAVLDAAFKQSGLVRCQSLEDFFDFARAFAWENAPQGPNIAVVSNAGGPAVIIADSIADADLQLSSFDEATHNQLLEKLPRSAGIINPVDVLGDALADRYQDAMDIVLQKDNVHALIVILTPQIMTQIDKTAEIIGQMGEKYHKPILCSFIGGQNISAGERILNQLKIPSFRFPERAVRALSAMWTWKKWQTAQKTFPSVPSSLPVDKPAIQQVLDSVRQSGRQNLDSLEGNALLAAASIPLVPTREISDFSSALAFLGEHGWPLVLKISSPDLLHKTESGAVITDITTSDQLQAAFTRLSAQITGSAKIIIQSQVISGREVIIGIKTDPNFGPVLMFGAGGILTEFIADRNLHLLPLAAGSALDLINQSKISKLLNGYRGHPPYDKNLIVDVMLRLSSLVENFPAVSQIEINPAIITEKGIWAVDVKVILV